MRREFIIVTCYRGKWGNISNYGWTNLADAYKSIAHNMDIYRDFTKSWKDREFSIIRKQSGNTARLFTPIEAFALKIHIEQIENGGCLHPRDIKRVCEHVGISRQKLTAMGKKIFNEVVWPKSVLKIFKP